MDIDLKSDAEKWGQDWLDRFTAASSTDNVSPIQPFEVFIRPRLVELTNMNQFAAAELVQWIETAHFVVARAIFGYQTLIKNRGAC